jgi:hypothetical protein
MAQVSPVTIVNSSLNIAAVNNNQKASITTHNLSSFIAGNTVREFVLNPPPVTNTLMVILDGLVLKPTFDNSAGDYSFTVATNTLTLSQDLLFEVNTVLLAIYQEV